MLIEKQSVTASDLEAINRHTLRTLTENEVYVFSAKFIDDQPTENGRIWSREWQEANVKKFLGVPVIVNHENNQQLVLGRVYHAEQKDNAITGKVYVPLDTDVGKEARAKIEAGLFKSVSIGANAENVKQEGKHVRILPSDSDRIYELSFVAIPGCGSCGVKKECSCQSDKQENVGNDESVLLEFARGELQTIKNEFVRLAGLTLSISDRPLLESVASSIDPKTLKQFSQKLRDKYLADNKSQPDPATDTNDDTQRIRESLSNIRKVKGV